LFFGGINGFNSFFPSQIEDDPYLPAVVITDFQMLNKSVEIGKKVDGRTVLETSVIEADNISLSYDDDVISFQFAALHFAMPEKNQYAYIMDGFDREWQRVGTRNFATYTNLPPGDGAWWAAHRHRVEEAARRFE